MQMMPEYVMSITRSFCSLQICHSKSGEINPVKVNNLVKAYVQRYKYFRKHGKKMDDDESSSSYRSGKDQGGLDKALPPLPLIWAQEDYLNLFKCQFKFKKKKS